MTFSPSPQVQSQVQKLSNPAELFLFKLDNFDPVNLARAIYFCNDQITELRGTVASGSTSTTINLGYTIRLPETDLDPWITVYDPTTGKADSRAFSYTVGTRTNVTTTDRGFVPATGSDWVIDLAPHPIAFQNQIYQAVSCELREIEMISDGARSRPVLKVGDMDNSVSSLLYEVGDLAGAKLTVMSVLKPNLDGFPSAGNFIKYRTELKLEKLTANGWIPGEYVEYECSSKSDFDNVQIGRRLGINCPFSYRRTLCGYSGTNYFTINNQVTANAALDQCAKTGQACRLRYGNAWASKFGGFPFVESVQ